MESLTFAVQISTAKNDAHPAEIFSFMAASVNAFDTVDNLLLHAIRPGLSSSLTLQELEIGSLRSWLATELRGIPDEVLSPFEAKKLIGHFLVRAKYIILRFLERNDSISNLEEIKPFSAQLRALINEIAVLPGFELAVSITKEQILQALTALSAAIQVLPPDHKAVFKSAVGEVEFNPAFSLDQHDVEDLLTANSELSLLPAVLTVKKPDYLGTSKWDLQLDGKIISVRIEDQNWLKKFHSRQISLKPGDAIEGRLAIERHVDEDGMPIKTNYVLARIDGIVNGEQQHLNIDSEG